MGAIRQSDGFTTEFERISPQSNSKFDLKVSVDKGDTTTIDQLFVYLIDNEFGKQNVEKLKRFLQNNQFDSDCLNEDGLAHIDDKECLELMREFIQKLKKKSTTFGVGMRFYYWKWYSDKTVLPANESMIGLQDNKHFHAGVEVSDLYVEAKYGSFKEEWQNYSHLNVK